MLKQQLQRTLGQVEKQIVAIRKEAEAMGISEYDLRDSSGNWVLAPLLVAKVQIMHAMALIR